MGLVLAIIIPIFMVLICIAYRMIQLRNYAANKQIN